MCMYADAWLVGLFTFRFSPSTDPYMIVISAILDLDLYPVFGDCERFSGFGYSLAMTRYTAWIVRARIRESAKPKMPIIFSRVISAIISEDR